MKYLHLLIFIPFWVNAQNPEDSYVLRKVPIESEVLEDVVRNYCKDEADALIYPGVLVFHLTPSTDTVYVTYQIYGESLVIKPPSFYAEVGDQIVIIYTGVEKYLKFSSHDSFSFFYEDTKDIFKNVKGVLYHPVIWKVTLKGKEYQRLFTKCLALNDLSVTHVRAQAKTLFSL